MDNSPSSYRGFYVIVSNKDSPVNALSTIRVHLSKPLQAENNKQKWEVALKSLSYPTTWYTIEEDTVFDIKLLFKQRLRIIGKEFRGGYNCRISLNVKDFTDLDSIINQELDVEVHRQITACINYYKDFTKQHGATDILRPDVTSEEFWNVRYDKSERRLCINDRRVKYNTTISILSGLKFWQIMGFTQFEENKTYELPLIATASPSLPSTTPLFFVMAPDLIRPQLIGDKFLPVLDVVPVKTRKAGADVYPITTYSMVNPIYKPLYGGYINEVKVHLYNELLEPLPILSGIVSLTLHFRPWRQWQS